MALSPFYFFGSIIAAYSCGVSVVLTDRLSKIAALGSGFLPYAILSSVLSAAFIRSQNPVSLQSKSPKMEIVVDSFPRWKFVG